MCDVLSDSLVRVTRDHRVHVRANLPRDRHPSEKRDRKMKHQNRGSAVLDPQPGLRNRRLGGLAPAALLGLAVMSAAHMPASAQTDMPTLSIVATSETVEFGPDAPAWFEVSRTGSTEADLPFRIRFDETAQTSTAAFRAGDSTARLGHFPIDTDEEGNPLCSITFILETSSAYAVSATASSAKVTVTPPQGKHCPVGADHAPVEDPMTLEDAFAVADGATPDEATTALFGEGTMSEARLAALDRLGNGNGRYDLGDFLSWLDRCRRGEAHCGDPSTNSPPVASAALLALAVFGRGSILRRPRRRSGRDRGGHELRNHRTRAARFAFALLLAVGISWSCSDSAVEPAAEADPGFLTIEWDAPAAGNHIGVLLELDGPGIETVRAPGLELYESGAAGPRRIILAGPLRAGPLAQFRVPDRNQLPLYQARVLEVTGEDYGLRDAGAYRLAITN